MDQLVYAGISSAFQLVKEYFQPPDSNIDAIKGALSRLQAMRDDVANRVQVAKEHEVPTNEVKEWLDKVEKVGFETNAIIKSYTKCRCLGCFSPNFLCINSSSTDVFANICGLIERGKFRSVTMRQSQDIFQELPIMSRPVGLQSYLCKVATFLADDEERIMAITGMGGVGKTLLMKNINNELHPGGLLSANSNFDCVIWIVASKNCNLENLQKKILKALNPQEDPDAENLATAIYRNMRKKNFLLLLDDVWEPLDLENAGIPGQRRDNTLKGKVILTTRSEDICARMDAKCNIKMKLLEDTDAWLLFKEKVGEELISDERLLNLAKDIAKECDGLPLALLAVARAMATKRTLEEWQHSLKLLRYSRHCEIPGNLENLFLKLKLSYDSLLNDTQKQCFLSCALWPENYLIHEEEVIWNWIGLGFLEVGVHKDIDSAFMMGHFIIGKLAADGLLERVLDDEIKKVKMHDVIRDMALWIANGEGENTSKWVVIARMGLEDLADDDLSNCQRAHRMSLIDNQFKSLCESLCCPNLLSLMLQQNDFLTDIAGKFFQQLDSLSYLDLSSTYIRSLPDEVGSLRNLHYLNLSDTCLSSLPETLKNLKNLNYLFLRNTPWLSEIPYGLISSLSMLMVLDMFGSRFSWQELADDNDDILDMAKKNKASIEEFRNLSMGLKFLGISVRNFQALKQLSETPRVSTRLLEIVGWDGDDALQNLISLLWQPKLRKKLQVLHITNTSSTDILTVGAWNLPELKALQLRLMHSLKDIIWQQVEPQHYLPVIRKLVIIDCGALKNVTWILQLRSLEHLELQGCNSLTQVGKEGDERIRNPFPCLRTLLLFDLKNLHAICNKEYAFPSLKVLNVFDCPNLGKLPFGPEIIHNKSLIIEGQREWWDKVKNRIANADVKLFLDGVASLS